MSCPQPQVARYRVQASEASGTFGPDSTYGAGTSPLFIVIGDLNGDGSLDLAVANSTSQNISVLLDQMP